FRDLAGHICAYELREGHLNWEIDIPQNSRAQERLPAIRLLHDSTLIGEETGGCLMVIDTEGDRLTTQNVGKRICTNISSIGSESMIFGTSGSLVAYQILSTPEN